MHATVALRIRRGMEPIRLPSEGIAPQRISMYRFPSAKHLDNCRENGHDCREKCLPRTVPDSDPYHCGNFGTTARPTEKDKVFIFGDDRGTSPEGFIPDFEIGSGGHVQITDV